MENNILYHYTSLEVLKCIFENYSKDNPYLTFWATNCTFMNDPREISEGIELVKNVLDDNLPPIHRDKAKIVLETSTEELKDFLITGTGSGKSNVPYAVSLSGNGDNLNMWRMYGDSGKGVALGFDLTKLRVNDADLIKCIYTQDNEILKYKDDIINEFIHLYDALGEPPHFLSLEAYAEIMSLYPICRYVSKVKNHCYKYEDEYRLITDSKNPEFRVAKGVMRPYVKLEIPANALQCIVIGPDCNLLNINSLKLFFASKGLNRIEENFYQSNVPYRN